MHALAPALRRAAALAAVVLTTWLGAAGAAGADPQIPWSGDERATPAAGVATGCAATGLKGEQVDVTVTRDSRYLTVTAVDPGVTLTGVVIQGGPGYNIYPASAFTALPWPRLHAPLESPAQPQKPALTTNWFACGSKTPPTSTSTTTTSTTTRTTTSSTTTRPTTTSTTSTSSSPSQTPVSATPPPVTSTSSPGLATTGFDGGWLIPLAAGLILLGAAALFVPRLLRRRG
ncbi:hypothetical protein [Crossiella cryophila]|uniref:LPXTG cell wall anchor domain-containing protein n=1 Tax=Crossiella cryophila TaxID=43355 RepID=A0A7W7CJG2_9PSEU|nr:hypothetical protein [Crossiella cryophila]MBB4682407.1 hypothetical protein [Crossiella cryophila]